MPTQRIAHRWLLFGLLLVVAPGLFWIATWMDGQTSLLGTSLAAKCILVLGAVCLFEVVDRCWLPWLQVEQVIFRKGSWEDRHVPEYVRGAVIRGWFQVKCCIILVVGWGGL